MKVHASMSCGAKNGGVLMWTCSAKFLQSPASRVLGTSKTTLDGDKVDRCMCAVKAIALIGAAARITRSPRRRSSWCSGQCRGEGKQICELVCMDEAYEARCGLVEKILKNSPMMICQSLSLSSKIVDASLLLTFINFLHSFQFSHVCQFSHFSLWHFAQFSHSFSFSLI